MEGPRARVPAAVRLVLVVLGLAGVLATTQGLARAFRLTGLRRLALFVVVVAVGVAPVALCLYGGLWTRTRWALASVGLVGTCTTAAVLAALAAARWLARGGRELLRRIARRPAPPTIADDGRRRVVRQLGAVATLGGCFGSVAYGALFGVHDYQTEDVSIPFPGLPGPLDGYRVVQLSDIHFGEFVGEREARAAVELVEHARPDLVVLTGDLVDWDAAHVPILGRLVHRLAELGARDGVVVVPGNHDHYVGVGRVMAAARRAGATVLRNDARRIAEGHLALLGIDWGEQGDLGLALSRAAPGLPRLLLAHDPRAFDRARAHVALQLSGHTHGGQISPLGLNPTRLVYRYVRGLYREGSARLYVNRGFGVAGPPLRLGSAPEVTVLHLQSG